MFIFSAIGVIAFLNSMVSYVPDYRQSSNLAAWYISAFLTVIFMFQYNIGGDYFAYQFLYGKSEGELLLRGFAPGFSFIFNTFYGFGLPFQSIYIFLGLAVMVLCTVSYRTISSHFNISFPLLIFLFFSWLYLDYLGVLRQAVAQTLLLGAYVYSLRNKIKASLFITFFAVLFHYSAIFFFIFYAMKYFPMKLPVKLMFAIIIAVIFIFTGGVALISDIWVALKLPYHTYFTSSIWLTKETTLYSKIISIILINFVIFILAFRAKLLLPNDLIYFFTSYVLLRAFTMDWAAGHRVLMVYEPFLLVFVAYLVDKAFPKIFVQKTLASLSLAALLFFHMLGNQILRLSDDPSFSQFSLSLDGRISSDYRLDVLQ